MEACRLLSRGCRLLDWRTKATEHVVSWHNWSARCIYTRSPRSRSCALVSLMHCAAIVRSSSLGSISLAAGFRMTLIALLASWSALDAVPVSLSRRRARIGSRGTNVLTRRHSRLAKRDLYLCNSQQRFQLSPA